MFVQTHLSNVTLPAFPFRVACEALMGQNSSLKSGAPTGLQLLDNMLVLLSAQLVLAGRWFSFLLPSGISFYCYCCSYACRCGLPGEMLLGYCTMLPKTSPVLNCQLTLRKMESGITSERHELYCWPVVTFWSHQNGLCHNPKCIDTAFLLPAMAGTALKCCHKRHTSL